MAVKPLEIQLSASEHSLGRPARGASGEVEAELGIELARLDVLVGGGFYPRRDPDHDRHTAPCGTRNLLESFYLGLVVDHYAAYSHLHGHLEFPNGFRVAVEKHPACRKSRYPRGVHLAGRHHVEPHAFLLKQFAKAGAQECLAGVVDPAFWVVVLERLSVGTAVEANHLFQKHHER